MLTTTVKETGIMMKGHNVLACMNGKKTQTRRVLRNQPHYSDSLGCWLLPRGRST
jgi:hypothetical protein